MLTPRSIRALALAAAALTWGCGGDEPPPNIVLVTLDTTRPDFMSTYGYEAGTTPHFDSLAERGVRFDHALSTSAVTPVSHASILTGLYQYNHGLRVLSAPSGYRLPEDAPTLVARLKSEGYSTGAVLSAFPVSDHFGFARDFDSFESVEGEMRKPRSWDVKTLQRRSDTTTDLALEFVNEAEGPFFLWIHYWDPHDPYIAPPDEFVAGIPREWPSDRWYAAEIRYMDEQFGRLLGGLESAGLRDSTMIAVTSDHGEGLLDGEERHGWSGHRMVYEEQLRVPLLLDLPGGPMGRAIPDVVSTVDITPTLLDYAGFEVHGGLDGRSLRDLIEGTAAAPRVAYADQVNGYDLNAGLVKKHPEAAFLYCLVEHPWKLTYRPHMPHLSELFHLADDPLEKQNRYGDRPEVVRRMLDGLAAREPWVLEPFASDGPVDPRVQRALAALGYGANDSAGDAGGWRWTCPGNPAILLDEDGPCEECDTRLVPVLVEK